MSDNNTGRQKRKHNIAFSRDQIGYKKGKKKLEGKYTDPFTDKYDVFTFFYTKTIWNYLYKHGRLEDAIIFNTEVDLLRKECENINMNYSNGII